MHRKLFLFFVVTMLTSITPVYASEYLEIIDDKYVDSGIVESKFLETTDVVKAPIPGAAVTDSSITWVLHKGSTRLQLREWAKKGGYQLVWNATRDYQIDAGAEFTGDFLAVFSSVINSLRETGTPIKAQIYGGNKVIVIREG